MIPFVKRNKTDAVDAKPICEAAQRPGMRFVAVKSKEQQAAGRGVGVVGGRRRVWHNAGRDGAGRTRETAERLPGAQTGTGSGPRTLILARSYRSAHRGGIDDSIQLGANVPRFTAFLQKVRPQMPLSQPCIAVPAILGLQRTDHRS